MREFRWKWSRWRAQRWRLRMAQRGRPKAPLVLTEEEQETLARWARRPKSPPSLALRSRGRAGRRPGQEQPGGRRRVAMFPGDGGQVAAEVRGETAGGIG